jgi:hypothetical protein
MKDRESRLLGLIAASTGHTIEMGVGSADDEEVPEDIARDSGLVAVAGGG